MNNIQVAIIEDEKPAARLLEGMIKKLRPQWDIIKIPGSIESSVAWFASHPHPDIVFLDIQLSDGNSFLFIEQACPTSLIIFTTAYDEYALIIYSNRYDKRDWRKPSKNSSMSRLSTTRSS